MAFFFLLPYLLLPVPPSSPPRLRVEPPGQVDLGSLGPLEKKEQTYLLRNTSAEPIALRVLDLSPGVTVRGPALAAPIPGGGGASLTLHLDPAGWQGFQTRNVRLETDDPGQGNYYLPVKAVIRPDLTVDEARKTFGDVAAHESPRQVFLFTRETGAPLALRVTSALPPYLDAEVEPEGNRARLALTLRPGRVPPGERLGLERLHVETNAPLQPAFDLYLGWSLHHAVEAEPPRVVFLDPARDRELLRLTSTDGGPFRIVDAKVDGPGFEVGRLPEGDAPAQVLELRRTAGAPARAMLELAFQGREGRLRVPLAYLPRSSAPSAHPL